MNKDALRQFLVDANKAGYAGGDERQWTREPDGSTTISFEAGGWRLHDNFFGGEPYGGRTVVFHEGKPAWMMVYYGWVAPEVEPNPVYGILRNALIEMPEEYPFRGPRDYRENGLIYTNSWDGDLDRFAGEEIITAGVSIIYKASYAGGLVDQRSGV